METQSNDICKSSQGQSGPLLVQFGPLSDVIGATRPVFTTRTVKLPDTVNFELIEEARRQKKAEAKLLRKTILVTNPTNFPDDIHLQCPQGIIYIGVKEPELDEKEVMRLWKEQVSDQYPNGDAIEFDDLFRIGRFIVNIGEATINHLKKMRSYWPKEDYRLLKNRKTARLQRLKRKVECT